MKARIVAPAPSPGTLRIPPRYTDMRLGDLFTFLAVHRNASITGAARELRVSPSQVSKAVSRLEDQLNIKLLSRSSRGVSLSEGGRRLLPYVEDAVGRLRLLGRDSTNSGATDLTLAAPSWLVHLFLPAIASSQPELRVRGLELPPPLLRAYAAENFFDLTLVTSDEQRFPGAWVSTHVGEIRKALYATPELARSLGAMPLEPDALKPVAFVSPIFNLNGQFVPVDDDCPLTHDDRTVGHEAQTIGLALELAATTGQLVFGPAVAARRYLASGALVELKVRGWDVTEPLFLVTNSDRVLARVQKAIVRALRAALRGLGASSTDADHDGA
jgi:DNA-binding transcriptional LysR family regulator